MDKILTDDERPKKPFSPYLFTEWRSELERVSSTMYTAEQMEVYADAIEAAVLAKLREQEPVAYIHRQGNHYEVSERFLCDDEKHRGWTEEPLYAAPLPAVVQVPLGWKLVPVEPTTEMLGAADREHAARGLVSIALISYRAMLAATPEAPAQPSVPAPWREAVKVAREDFRCLLSYVERAAAGADVAWSDLMEDVGKDCRAALTQLDSLEGGE